MDGRKQHGGREWSLPFTTIGCVAAAQLLVVVVGSLGIAGSAGLQVAYVLLCLATLGVVVFLARRLLHGGRLEAVVHLLDAAMLTLAITFLLWEQVIRPALGDPAQWSVVQQVVVVLLPALDVMVVSVVSLLVLLDRSPDHVARLQGTRPTVARMVVVNATVVVALWVATWHYVVHSRPSSLATTVLGLLAGVVWGAEHIATFVQSERWADRLHANIDEIESAHTELRLLLDDLPEAVVVLDADGRIREANTSASALTGHTREELLGRSFAGLFSRAERERMAELWDRLRHSAGDDGLRPPTFVFVAADGSEVLLEADTIAPIRDPERVVITLRDVTERVLEAQRLERARERFRLAFHNAPTGMALLSAIDGTLIDVNDSLIDMLERTRYELVGSHIDEVTHPQELGRTMQMLQQTLRDRSEGYRTEQRFVRADGATVWARTWVSVMTDEDDSLAIAHIEDITEQRHIAERMEWAATHDGLTGLPNRFRFLERLGTHLESATPGSIAVLFIDLDNFKVINDSLGHDAGDQLLRAMSDRLRSVVRDRDLLGRFGGDEFMVMLRDVGVSYDPREVAERLRAEVAKPVMVDGSELYVTATIGITISDREGVSTSELLRDADAAMYRAKARGRDCVEVFAPGSHDASVLTLRTSNELRRGIDRGEIVPYYQPIVRLDDGQLMGFEVLARWRHPDRGLLAPEQFLPLAEETGLIGEVGTAMLQSSLVQLGQWRNNSQRFSDLSLSVNLSVRQLASVDLVNMVRNALTHAGVSAGALWLELTETALMSDVKAATVTLRELRGLGLHLSVDDFGTGYSSLTYLKRFPVEAIKVDRSFVNGLGIDAEDTTIVEAVVKLGHSLGLQVVAEGVETPLQLTRLREIGCDRGQGYLFGRPRPAELITSEYSLA